MRKDRYHAFRLVCEFSLYLKYITIKRQDDKQIKQIIIDFKPANNVGE